MKIKKIMTIRLWILLFALVISLLAINPNPWAEGIEIKTVDQSSLSYENGVREGQVLKSINDQPVNSLEDYNNIIKTLEREPINLTVITDKGTFEYSSVSNLAFRTDEDLTITYADQFIPLEYGMKIEQINDFKINSTANLTQASKELFQKEKITISTDKGTFVFLLRGPPEITVKNMETSNLKKGLDLAGGTRVLIKPVNETGEVTNKDIQDLIKVLGNRLNVYGLSDLKIRSANDWENNRFILIEIAGITDAEIRELIGKQGKFEAKISNQTVFEGGKRDITFVCRDDGSCSGIRDCSVDQGTHLCKFEFVIHLSPDAAKKHAEVTKDIPLATSSDGRKILEENINFYLDGKLVDSLQISSDLKGKETQAIAISGPGTSSTRQGAIENAIKNMDKLQTVIITGSLPLDIEIAEVDTISPVFGASLIKNSILVGIIAILSVALIVFIRYRNLKIILPMIFAMVSEIVLILGFAAVIGWNLDMVAIAGIIAAVGTGVDDQIVITDEVLKGKSRFLSWKEKIKRAFFIIFTAYATTVVAMAPLWNAGAGLVRGFVVTTIVGVTFGVLLTRPAYASIIEKILNQ